MEKPIPMDRLLCGDVGFGKTEVAFRAAFKAILSNKQVMLLCPTTILARQHHEVALGRFAPFIKEENDYEMIFVANFFRPLTRTAEDALVIMREVEAASHLEFTAIANNSNLGEDTTAEDLLSTVSEIEMLSKLSSLPVIMTTAKEDLCNSLEGKIDNLFPLKLQSKII